MSETIIELSTETRADLAHLIGVLKEIRDNLDKINDNLELIKTDKNEM